MQAIQIVVDYTILQLRPDGQNVHLIFADKVKQHLQEGWQPYGPFQLIQGEYVQAMVKYEYKIVRGSTETVQ